MTAYGEFTPTEDQMEIVRAAAETRPQNWPGGHRWRFILPGQPIGGVTWKPKLHNEEPVNGKLETGLCWVEDVPLVRMLGFDWMLRVQARGEDFLVREGRFFKIIKTSSDSDAVGRSDGPQRA